MLALGGGQPFHSNGYPQCGGGPALERASGGGVTLGFIFFLSILIIPMVPKNCATWSSVTLLGRPLQGRAGRGAGGRDGMLAAVDVGRRGRCIAPAWASPDVDLVHIALKRVHVHDGSSASATGAPAALLIRLPCRCRV